VLEEVSEEDGEEEVQHEENPFPSRCMVHLVVSVRALVAQAARPEDPEEWRDASGSIQALIKLMDQGVPIWCPNASLRREPGSSLRAGFSAQDKGPGNMRRAEQPA